MAVPVFDWNSANFDNKWALYLVIFLPLTAIVLAVYFIWIFYGHQVRRAFAIQKPSLV
jgi:hypothetical protein